MRVLSASWHPTHGADGASGGARRRRARRPRQSFALSPWKLSPRSERRRSEGKGLRAALACLARVCGVQQAGVRMAA
eukprot:2729486-Rhodomonas_salina.1